MLAGSLIIKLRKQRGWTQADLAARLNVAESAIGHWENGRRVARPKVLRKMARLLGTTVGALYGERR